MLERNWPAAIRVIQRWRKEGATYDAIAKHLASEKFETITGLTVWNVGTVWNIARAGDQWIAAHVKDTVFEDPRYYPS